MALNHFPKPKMVLSCDYEGFKKPEMIKPRPVIVLSSSRARPDLCIVVPLSRTPPEILQKWHIPLSRASSWDRQKRWVKCDMINTVSFRRLDRWMKGNNQRTGKRMYLSFKISDDDFNLIKLAITHILSL